MPANSKTSRTFATSSGTSPWRWLISKRAPLPCSDSLPSKHPKKHNLPFHAEVPHGRGAITGIQAAARGGNTWQHGAGCVYPKRCGSTHCPPPVTLTWCCSGALCSKPALTVSDYSPEACAKSRARELHLCCGERFFFSFKSAPSLSEVLTIQRS